MEPMNVGKPRTLSQFGGHVVCLDILSSMEDFV